MSRQSEAEEGVKRQADGASMSSHQPHCRGRGLRPYYCISMEVKTPYGCGCRVTEAVVVCVGITLSITVTTTLNCVSVVFAGQIRSNESPKARSPERGGGVGKSKVQEPVAVTMYAVSVPPATLKVTVSPSGGTVTVLGVMVTKLNASCVTVAIPV